MERFRGLRTPYSTMTRNILSGFRSTSSPKATRCGGRMTPRGWTCCTTCPKINDRRLRASREQKKRPRHVEQTRSRLLYFVSEADTASRRRPSASQILATVSMVTFMRPFSIRQRWPASRPQRSARSRTESPAALRA